MLSLLGMCIFVTAELLFHYGDAAGSTNWSIFYFSSSYVGWALVGIDLAFKDKIKAVKYSGIMLASILIMLAGIELMYINVPFEKYIVNVNENKIKSVTYGILGITSIMICLSWIKIIIKHLQK